MGEVKALKWAYFGIHTQRAVQDFPICGLHFSLASIQALGLIPGEKLDLLLAPLLSLQLIGLLSLIPARPFADRANHPQIHSQISD